MGARPEFTVIAGPNGLVKADYAPTTFIQSHSMAIYWDSIYGKSTPNGKNVG
nr:hypothetical protein [uncultured Bacteroides sp.]